MKVLMLAFECNPDWPSLPAVAYKYARAVAETDDVTLVTQVLNRPNIERAGTGRLKVDYVDIDPILVPLDRLGKLIRGGNSLGWTTQIMLTYPSYVAFETAVWRRYRGRLRAGEFDVVHRSTPMTPTIPSPLAKWSPVPFVLGPLNGGLGWPPQFRHMQQEEREWLRPLRGLHRHLPYHRSTFDRSAAILAGFEHTIRDIPGQYASKVIDFPEIGVDPELFSSAHDPARYESRRLTVVFAGRLVPLKLPDVVLGAFARSPLLRQHRLLIAGEGPDGDRIARIVASEKLEDCVELSGKLTQEELAARMREAQILAFPSVKDLGAGIVAEAMACGLCPVVVDWGASSTLVDASRGIKLPLGTTEELTCRCAAALERLVADRTLLAGLARNAEAFAGENLTWQDKAERTREVYRWVLGGRVQPKPAFWRVAANGTSRADALRATHAALRPHAVT